MPEHVVPVDLGVTWDPNAPSAVLVAGDLLATVLALDPHPVDPDDRKVVLVWRGAVSSSLGPPNDEGLEHHRLWSRGLHSVLWAGTVEESELVRVLLSSSARPTGSASTAWQPVHHVLVLKECVVEVVAENLQVQRHATRTTLDAAAAAAAAA